MKRPAKSLWRAMLALTLALLLLPVQAFTALAAEEIQTITYHNLTVDPNGGAFADGSSEAKTFQLRSTGYMKPEDYQSAGFNQQYAGLTRSGYLPSGYGTSKSGPVTVGLYDLANTRFTEDTTLYVIWGKAVQMTIYANGGMLFQYTPDGAVSLDDPYVTMVPAGDPIPVSVLNRMAVRDGYSFAGLSTDAAGKQPVSPVERDGVMCYVAPESDVTYYVQWAKITISAQPQDVTAAVGSEAVFTVSAEGNGLTYQWQFKKPAGNWTNSGASGCRTDTLTVTPYGSMNGYQYRCVISNANGETLHTNAVKLLISTTITSQPKDVTAASGSTATFAVAATGAGLTYRWQFKPLGGSWSNSSASGCRTASLTVISYNSMNGHQYRCAITDANGTVTYSDAAALKVAAMSIPEQPKDVTAAVGTTARFHVTVSGTGLKYQWQFKKPAGNCEPNQ